jgi:hypothetical protein
MGRKGNEDINTDIKNQAQDISTWRLATMAHIYNPSYFGRQRSGGLQFTENPHKKLARLSQSISQVWWHTSSFPAASEPTNRRFKV